MVPERLIFKHSQNMHAPATARVLLRSAILAHTHSRYSLELMAPRAGFEPSGGRSLGLRVPGFSSSNSYVYFNIGKIMENMLFPKCAASCRRCIRMYELQTRRVCLLANAPRDDHSKWNEIILMKVRTLARPLRVEGKQQNEARSKIR